MNKRVLVLISACILLIVAGMAVFLYFQAKDTPSPQQPMQPPAAPITPSTPAEPSLQPTPPATPTTHRIQVFFSKHPDSDNDPSKTFPVTRISLNAAVGTYAISQLIVGPTADEIARGYFSNVRVRSDASICNEQDFKLSIQDTVATLQFCRTFDALGSVSDGQAQETIKATLLQFATIKKVIILSKTGNCQFDMSGLNLCLE